MLKLIMPHIHQQGMKQFITHIMRLSGEVKASVPSWSNMVWERQKMKLVWGFHSGQVGVWGEGLCTQVEAFIVWTSHQHQKRAHLGFLASLPRGGAGEGGARLKSCQHTWRNEVWLFITPGNFRELWVLFLKCRLMQWRLSGICRKSVMRVILSQLGRWDTDSPTRGHLSWVLSDKIKSQSFRWECHAEVTEGDVGSAESSEERGQGKSRVWDGWESVWLMAMATIDDHSDCHYV